jgi:peptidoglycan/xylan/chitin deacetylase (PgdA/CDA1 family)
MKLVVYRAVIIFLFLGILPTALTAQKSKANASRTPPPPVFTWPNGTKAAVSLTYDDGRATQYKAGGAADQLQAAGLRGTFFVVRDWVVSFALVPRWQEIYRMGHEIGSHSTTHPCNGDPRITNHFTKDQMTAELDGAVGFLKSLTGTAGPFTHAYPCGEVRDDSPYYMNLTPDDHSLVPLVKARFFAARATLPSMPVVPDDDTLPDDILYTVPAPCVDTSASQGIQFLERARKKNGWIVLCFHEIDNTEHEKVIQYLLTHRAEYCVDTFGNMAKYVWDALQNHPTDQTLCPLSKPSHP